MQTHRIAKVEWLDIASYYGWKDKDETNDYESVSCVSCGILTKVKRGHLGLAQTVSETEKRAEMLVIPRKVVTRIEIISRFRK